MKPIRHPGNFEEKLKEKFSYRIATPNPIWNENGIVQPGMNLFSGRKISVCQLHWSPIGDYCCISFILTVLPRQLETHFLKPGCLVSYKWGKKIKQAE